MRWMHISHWCIYPQIVDEITRILTMKDELSKPDGHLPYIRSLCIPPKSPYSATANPNLHYFCKMVGVFEGKDMSINAIVVYRAVENDAFTI